MKTIKFLILFLPILFGGIFHGYAISPTSITLTASKSYPSTYIDFTDTLDNLFHFAVPQSIPVTKGKAGTGTLTLKFNFYDKGIVSCNYTASATGASYEFSTSSAGIKANQTVTTDYFNLRVNDGDPTAGLTTIAVTLSKVTISKDLIKAPYPRILTSSNTPPTNARTGPQQSCSNATSICGGNTVINEPDAYSFQNNGINSTISCLGTGELNGVWYQFVAGANGNLNFTITPNVPTLDYDWAVYNITNSSCGAITTNPGLQVGCNYSGATGTNGQTGPNGQSGSQFTGPINVIAGNTYRIFVSFYNSSEALTANEGAGLGFSLNLSASTAGLFTTPTITVNPSAPVICAGESVTLTASGAGTNGTYTWMPGSATGASITVSPTTTTTYTVTGTTAAGCQNTRTAKVTVNPTPFINVTPSTPTICAGASVTLTASGATSYSWTPTAGLNPSTGSTVTASPTVTTKYTVSGSNGTCTGQKDVTVTVNPLPTVIITPSAPSICKGQSVTLIASGANSYTWSPGGATGTSIYVSPTATTTYTVTGKTGSCTNTGQVTVTVNPLPSIAVTPSSAAICNGETVTLTASGGTSYTWSPTTIVSPSTGATVIANPTSTRTITVTGTNGICTNTATSTITVNPKPTITVTPSSATLCSGSSVTLTANGATTYSWTPSQGLNPTSGATVVASPTTTTTYTVTGSNGYCTNIKTVKVIVNPAISVLVSPSAPSICKGASVTLKATGASSYTWSPASGLSTTTGSSVVATPVTTTTYTVTGTSGPCVSSKDVTVTVNLIPTITVTPSSSSICPGTPVTLTASGASTYKWTPTAGIAPTTGATVTANVSVASTYTVTGTSAAGCSGTAIANISIKPATECCSPTAGTVTSVTKLSQTQNIPGPLDPLYWFGSTAKGIGDLDGDGVEDMVAYSGFNPHTPLAIDRTGFYILFMNSNKTVKSTKGVWLGSGILPAPTSLFSTFGPVSSLGDLDNDGVVDLVVSDYADYSAGQYAGAFWILYMKTDGTVKSYIKHTRYSHPSLAASLLPRDGFGVSVSKIGDLDNDGIEDIVVGKTIASTTTPPSAYVIFLNANGSIKNAQEISGRAGGMQGVPGIWTDGFGAQVSGIGDIDGDGNEDIAVSSTGEKAIYILFLNTNGTVKTYQKISDSEGNFSGPSQFYFGFGISLLGDLDCDGVNDIAVGDIYQSNGRGQGGFWILFLKQNGTVKCSKLIDGTLPLLNGQLEDYDFFGQSVGVLGDLDNNGTIEIAVGAPRDDDGWQNSIYNDQTGYDAGAVYVLSLDVCSGYQVNLRENGSALESTATEENLSGYTLHPNPFIDETTLELKNGIKDENVQIAIVNLQGTLLWSKENHSSSEPLKIGQDLKAGMYLVKITKQGGETEVLTFIKN